MLAAREAVLVRRLGPAREGDEDLRAPARRSPKAASSGARRRQAADPPHTRRRPTIPTVAARLVRALRGRGSRRRDRQARRRRLPAGQARDDEDQAPAHRRLRGRRASAGTRAGRARSSARCCSGSTTTPASCTTSASPRRSSSQRRELAEELKPLPEGARDDHPWRDVGRGETTAQRLPGEPSRWNRGKDLSWEPIQLGLVCEVSFDHLQGPLPPRDPLERWRPTSRRRLPLRSARRHAAVLDHPVRRQRSGLTRAARLPLGTRRACWRWRGAP